ncbi:MAG: hypothetical protein O7D91_08840 [Planctomycetota bacterium]|nr:hypothetical protein [Planctomycetota bacterium]
MGDRCYMEIQCSREHYESVLREYFIEILEEDGGYVKAADPEANYAYTNEIEEWADQGLIFIAYHDVGDNYGGYEIACDGKELCDAPHHRDRGLVVQIDEKTGQPVPGGLEQVQKLLEIRRRATKHLAGLRAANAGRS